MQYSVLSQFYDKYFYGDYLDKIKKKYLSLLLKNGIKSGNILDAGCGTGMLTSFLAEKGYNLVGVDISPKMLEIASSKMPSIDYYCMDISKDLPRESFNAIISSLDVVNHILNEESVYSFFENAYKSLSESGVLIFDINTKKKFLRQYGNNRYVYSSYHSLCVWDNEYDSETKLCKFTLNIYKKENEKYSKSQECFYEKYYSFEQIKNMLIKSGFRKIKVNATDKGTRYILTAIKKREI